MLVHFLKVLICLFRALEFEMSLMIYVIKDEGVCVCSTGCNWVCFLLIYLKFWLAYIYPAICGRFQWYYKRKAGWGPDLGQHLISWHQSLVALETLPVVKIRIKNSSVNINCTWPLKRPDQNRKCFNQNKLLYFLI